MLICILVSDSFTFVPYIPHYNTDLGQVFLVFLLVVRKSLKVAHKVFTLHFSYFGKSSARLKPRFLGSSNPFNPTPPLFESWSTSKDESFTRLVLPGCRHSRETCTVTLRPGGLKGGFNAQQCPPLLGVVYGKNYMETPKNQRSENSELSFSLDRLFPPDQCLEGAELQECLLETDFHAGSHRSVRVSQI